MKNHYLVLLVAASCWVPGEATAQRMTLVTPEEASVSQAAGGMIVPRSTPQPGAPQIALIAPDVSRPVGAPTPVEVRFFGTAPAEVRPETFRVLYGSFRIDITQRLLGVAKVTKEGINVSEAVLPTGRHQLLLSIKDSLDRETIQVFSFVVR